MLFRSIMIPENAIFPLFGKEFALDEDNKAIYIVDKYSEMSAGAYGGDVSEEDKKLIMDNMRYIPRINDMFKDYEKNTVIFSQNSGFEIRQIARLNERVPGDYVSFSVEDDRSMDGFFSMGAYVPVVGPLEKRSETSDGQESARSLASITTITGQP